MLLILVSNVDKVPVQEQDRLVDELLSLALCQQHGAAFVHQVGVQQLRLLILLQSVKSILGPAKPPHDQGELKPGLINMGSEGNDPCVTLLCLLQLPQLGFAFSPLQPNSCFSPPDEKLLFKSICGVTKQTMG